MVENTTDEANDKPRQTLCWLVANDSAAVTDQPEQLKSLLKQSCGDYRRELNAIFAAMDAKIPEKLTSTKKIKDKNRFLDDLIDTFAQECGLRKPWARWAIESWAIALGTIPSPARTSEDLITEAAVAETPVSEQVPISQPQPMISAASETFDAESTQPKSQTINLIAIAVAAGLLVGVAGYMLKNRLTSPVPKSDPAAIITPAPIPSPVPVPVPVKPTAVVTPVPPPAKTAPPVVHQTPVVPKSAPTVVPPASVPAKPAPLIPHATVPKTTPVVPHPAVPAKPKVAASVVKPAVHAPWRPPVHNRPRIRRQIISAKATKNAAVKLQTQGGKHALSMAQAWAAQSSKEQQAIRKYRASGDLVQAEALANNARDSNNRARYYAHQAALHGKKPAVTAKKPTRARRFVRRRWHR